MKHVFVINPRAGKIDRVKEISDQVKQFENEIDYEIYVTKSRGDAANFVHDYLKTHDENETYRFYACGGDGTLHDVANGVFGFKNAEIACYACGSGNDFIKYYDNLDEFRDLPSLIHAKAQPIDCIKCNDLICINILSIGFDAEVTFKMHDYKRKPLVTGKMAYLLASLHCLLFRMSFDFNIKVDDEDYYAGPGLLCIAANGSWYGGGFHCAPIAKTNDGLLDVCLAKCVKRSKSPVLMGVFKKGEHLTDKRLKDNIMYKQAKKLWFSSKEEIAYQVDGETYRVNELSVEVQPLALNFVVPVHNETEAK